MGYAQGQQTAERATDDDRLPLVGDAHSIQELKHLYPTGPRVGRTWQTLRHLALLMGARATVLSKL